jgi:hypothetical protein
MTTIIRDNLYVLADDLEAKVPEPWREAVQGLKRLLIEECYLGRDDVTCRIFGDGHLIPGPGDTVVPIFRIRAIQFKAAVRPLRIHDRLASRLGILRACENWLELYFTRPYWPRDWPCPRDRYGECQELLVHLLRKLVQRRRPAHARTRRRDHSPWTIPAIVAAHDIPRSYATFDATPWFAQATDNDIKALQQALWMDEAVARFIAGRDRKIAAFFQALDNKVLFFTTLVSRHCAMQWLQLNRSQLACAMGLTE